MAHLSNADRAREIRKALKAAHGWTGRQVSVRASNGHAVNVSIKSADIPLGIVEPIAEQWRKGGRVTNRQESPVSAGNRNTSVYNEGRRQGHLAPQHRRDDDMTETMTAVHEALAEAREKTTKTNDLLDKLERMTETCACQPCDRLATTTDARGVECCVSCSEWERVDGLTCRCTAAHHGIFEWTA